MKYIYREDLTSADIAVEVKGSNLHEIFSAAAYALISEMTEHPDLIKPALTRGSTLYAPDPEFLLFHYLNEILFYKDSEGIILKPLNIRIENNNDNYICFCEFTGEKIKNSRCGFRVDIKGIPLHELKIERSANSYSAVFLFDV